jgi:hypothetical protein
MVPIAITSPDNDVALITISAPPSVQDENVFKM